MGLLIKKGAVIRLAKSIADTRFRLRL